MLDGDIVRSKYTDMTILCVDDEASILRAIKRVFHQKPYRVLIADSGKKALEIMKEQTIHVIVSDMRMPEMDGLTLLEQSANLYPETYRIVLSGFADFESTVAAVNIGKINRFINKPWNKHELVSAIEECLQGVILKRENSLLRKKIELKNKELSLFNNELEEKIALRTKQIRAVLHQNERNNKASEKMLFNFIAINPNLRGNFAKNVGNLAGRLALKLGLEKEQIYEIRLAGFLHEIGMLGLESVICTTPYNSLNYEQRKKFIEQVNIANQILSPAHHMNNVSDIITHQFELIEKTTLLQNKTVEQGIQILSIARDYWRYAFGKIVPEKLDFIHTIIELTKGKEIKYNKKMLALLKSHPELTDDGIIEQGLSSKKLKPGMLLKYNLYTINHLLILAEGHEFSKTSIEKLIEYEKNQKHTFSIVIETTTNATST